MACGVQEARALERLYADVTRLKAQVWILQSIPSYVCLATLEAPICRHTRMDL